MCMDTWRVGCRGAQTGSTLRNGIALMDIDGGIQVWSPDWNGMNLRDRFPGSSAACMEILLTLKGVGGSCERPLQPFLHHGGWHFWAVRILSKRLDGKNGERRLLFYKPTSCTRTARTHSKPIIRRHSLIVFVQIPKIILGEPIIYLSIHPSIYLYYIYNIIIEYTHNPTWKTTHHPHPPCFCSLQLELQIGAGPGGHARTLWGSPFIADWF